MIGTVMRFKLKKTLVGIATLSMLCPMASHADVTPGKWIFDGFSRSTRDGQGSTCVGAGGDTHAFDVDHCNNATSETQQSRQAVHADKKAAGEAAAAARAQAKADAQAKLTGGHKDGGVLRPDGSRLRDGYGRDCVRNGSGLVVSGDCSVPSAPSSGSAGMSAATAAAAPAPAPVAPGSELAPGSKGAYVTRPAGTEVRDGYGRSCIKDGRWSQGLATENCDPGLFSAWRSTQQPEMELAKRIQMPPPQVSWPPAAPAPAANVAADTGSAAAPIEAPKGDAPVIDTALPVFPITKYEFSPEEEETAALLDDDDDDATDDIAADGAALADDDEDAVAMMADETDDDGIPEAEAMAAEDDDEYDSAVAAADDDDDDDDSDGVAAFAGDDVMRDDENLALAELGADDDLGDEEPDLLASDEADDDEPDVFASDDVMRDDENLALAELGDDGEPDLLAADETNDGEPDLFAEDDATSRVAESSLAPRIKQAPPEVVRSSEAVVVAAAAPAKAAAQSPAEFPVTKYEYDPNSSSGSLTTSDAAATAALAATADDADALADADDAPAPTAVAAAEQEYKDIPRPSDMLAASDRELPADKPEPLPPLTDPSDMAPPKDTPKVDGGGAKPAEPKPVAAAHSPEVSCPPTTIQLEPGRFDFDKWVLRPQAKEKLDAVAAKLKDNRCEAVNIIGHTDRIGSNKYNQRLSERRANAAKDYLVKKHGIAENLITAIGKGESELITKAADCKGKRKKALIACYGPDRRVEVTVRTK